MKPAKGARPETYLTVASIALGFVLAMIALASAAAASERRRLGASPGYAKTLEREIDEQRRRLEAARATLYEESESRRAAQGELEALKAEHDPVDQAAGQLGAEIDAIDVEDDPAGEAPPE